MNSDKKLRAEHTRNQDAPAMGGGDLLTNGGGRFVKQGVGGGARFVNQGEGGGFIFVILHLSIDFPFRLPLAFLSLCLVPALSFIGSASLLAMQMPLGMCRTVSALL